MLHVTFNRYRKKCDCILFFILANIIVTGANAQVDLNSSSSNTRTYNFLCPITNGNQAYDGNFNMLNISPNSNVGANPISLSGLSNIPNFGEFNIDRNKPFHYNTTEK